jgi:hypothetical protein
MPYTVNYSETGKTPIVVNDATVDTSTSLKLIGKNYNRFGEYLNEDLLHLLENFAGTTAPENPTEGQLWYDTSESYLKIYESGKWYTIGSPAGNTRMEVRVRLDTNGVSHYTIENIVDSVIVTILVDDTVAWTPASTEYLEDGVTELSTQFPVIQSGVNMNTTTNFKFRGIATSAEYADLAERYESDEVYEPGTVVRIGGMKEITQTYNHGDPEVFGIISTAPGFEMNSAAGSDDTHPFVALAGRVPCKVVGIIKKGDRMVTSLVAGHAEAAHMTDILDYRIIIGRALADKTDDGEGLIEVVVGAK